MKLLQVHLGAATLSILVLAVPALGGGTSLRLVSSSSEVLPGGQFTVEAFVSGLPVELRGYQVGLEITGGDSGQIAAVQSGGESVFVDEARGDWVFAGEPGQVISAGREVSPPAFLSLFFDASIGTQPTTETYLGTFILEASPDAAGQFSVGIAPVDPSDTTAGSILITTGGEFGGFPADIADPTIIPIGSPQAFSLMVTSSGVAAVPAVSEWGVLGLCLLLAIAGTLLLRQHRIGLV